MPIRNSIQELETKKRVSLLERNLLTALQNISILTLEVERMRNALAAKEGFEDLTAPVNFEEVQAAQAQNHQATSTATSGQGGGRRGPSSANQGRTLKVINN